MHTATVTFAGHVPGLFKVFFMEMWERFSYYGMRALLVFYMLKGFLGYNDDQAYATYASYGSMVYLTPYFGGLLADKLLGIRRSIIMGAVLMATGHLLMAWQNETSFFMALALIICGNGFFKPNASTLVGKLYSGPMEGKKDAGFTVFYMSVNLGAAIAGILCGYVGETYGWHYGFGIATAGMLSGLVVFVLPGSKSRYIILVSAVVLAITMPFLQDTTLQLVVRIFLSAAVLVAGVISFLALGHADIPTDIGLSPKPELLRGTVLDAAPDAFFRLPNFLVWIPKRMRVTWVVYLGTALVVVVFSFIVQRNAVAGWALYATGILAIGHLVYSTVFRGTKVERERTFFFIILMFFFMLFWAFFEQAGSSMNNFTDRNVDRVDEAAEVMPMYVGTTIRFRVKAQTTTDENKRLPLLTQGQLGHYNGDVLFTMDQLTKVRETAKADGARPEDLIFNWLVVKENIGMTLGGGEIPASEFQSANPTFIMLFGLLLTALWGFLGTRGREPSIPFKFGLGMLQLGLGFGCFWYGAQEADQNGMVWMGWLLLGILLHTTGELCLSPVGFSMVTKIAPQRVASTMMGMLLLSTAFSNYFAGKIAMITGSSHGNGGKEVAALPPAETVNMYQDVFGVLALLAIGAGVVLFLLTPLMKRWMHEGAPMDLEPEDGG